MQHILPMLGIIIRKGERIMKHAHLKHTLLLLLLASLTLCNCACDSFSQPSVTTVITNSFGQTIYPCLAPKGYTYPKNANPVYKEFGIWLAEDFYRPDIIWVDGGLEPFYIDQNMTKPGTISHGYGYWNYIGTDTDRFAVIFRELEDYDLNKLVAYLTDLGWESLSNQEPLFAATRDQINSLDCIALETHIGQKNSTGFALFSQFQNPHTHDPIEGDENCLWNCGSKLYQYLDEQAQ